MCSNCGAAVDSSGAFCWKCGVPLETGRGAFIPAPAESEAVPPHRPDLTSGYSDTSARVARVPTAVGTPAARPERFSPYGREERTRTPGWAKATIVILVAAVAVLGFLWISPYGNQLLHRPGPVEIWDVVYDPVYQGNSKGYFPSGDMGRPCYGACVLTPSSGSTFEIVVPLQNSALSSHTVTNIAVQSPFGLAYSDGEFSVPAATTESVILLLVAPAAPGNYSLTVTFYTS